MSLLKERVSSGRRHNVSVRASRFRGADGSVEHHIVVKPLVYAGFNDQVEWVLAAYGEALGGAGIDEGSAVFRRFFCSDIVNQRELVERNIISGIPGGNHPCALSLAGQAPGHPAKVMLWAYHLEDAAGIAVRKTGGGAVALRRGALEHHWICGLSSPSSGRTAYEQTLAMFGQCGSYLETRGMSVAANLLRTWIFIRDIDLNYRGMVEARKEYFARCGLSADTHFIASTGVEGRHVDRSAEVAMDAYAVCGIVPGQTSYLSAPDYLSPTHTYGVTFERGVSISYRDRKHLIISGTASIDKNGGIMHDGNVLRQLERSIENIEALLGRAGASLSDMLVLIVYVRDAADHEFVGVKMDELAPGIPAAVVSAPICRPGWLIEVEGIASVAASNPGLPSF